VNERMRSAAVVTIGTELVLGEVENTNLTWLCGTLTRLGMNVVWAATVPDEVEMIRECIRVSRAATDVIVVSGGLGGTPDDVTREGIARAFGVALRTDERIVEELRTAPGEHILTFADVWSRIPDGARPLFGAVGGVPGFALENVYVLPGMPPEMREMFGQIEPELGRGPELHTWSKTLPTSEHLILSCLEELAEKHPDVGCGSYPRFSDAASPEVKIVLRARSRDDLSAAARVVERFARTLGSEGMASGPTG